jgi:hypothetical protein
MGEKIKQNKKEIPGTAQETYFSTVKRIFPLKGL